MTKVAWSLPRSSRMFLELKARAMRRTRPSPSKSRSLRALLLSFSDAGTVELTNLSSNVKCKGPGNSCILRCKNAIGQPFGGCVVFKAAGGNKRSLFGRLAVEEDPEDVDTDEVEEFDAEETLEHHTDEAEESTSENLDDLD